MIEVIKTFLPEFDKQPIVLAKNKKKYDNLVSQYDEELCIFLSFKCYKIYNKQK